MTDPEMDISSFQSEVGKICTDAILSFLLSKGLKYEKELQLHGNITVVIDSSIYIIDLKESLKKDDVNSSSCKFTLDIKPLQEENNDEDKGDEKGKDECNTSSMVESHNQQTHDNGDSRGERVEKNVYCHQCVKGFTSVKSQKRHHTAFHMQCANHPFKCEICSRTFGSTNHLNRHRSQHLTNVSYKCGRCDTMFKNKSELNNHVCKATERDIQMKSEDVTDETAKTDYFMCEICFFIFKCEKTLKLHKERKHYTKSSGSQCETKKRNSSNVDDSVGFNSDTSFEPNLPSLDDSESGNENTIFENERNKSNNQHEETMNISEIPSKKSLLSPEGIGQGNDQCIYRCEKCGKQFGNYGNLQEHFRSKHGKAIRNEKLCISSLYCHFCSKAFGSTTKFKKHNEFFHPSVENHPFKCNHCCKSFRSGEHLQKHNTTCALTVGNKHLYISSRKPKEHKCNDCERVFYNSVTLRQHLLRTHGAENDKDHPFRCKICNACFGNKTQLKRHGLVHTEKRGYLCSQCGKTYKFPECLRKHEKVVHSNDENYRFQCKVCKFRASCNSKLERHMLSHTGEKPFLCSECGKSFKCSESLVKHQFSQHKSGSQFVCDVCQADFGSQWDMEKHKLNHLSLEKFTCQLCARNFSEKEQLKSHHTDEHPELFLEKPHECATCSNRFSTAKYLQHHTASHIEIQRYKCDMCNQGFKQYCSLARHRKDRCPNLNKANRSADQTTNRQTTQINSANDVVTSVITQQPRQENYQSQPPGMPPYFSLVHMDRYTNHSVGNIVSNLTPVTYSMEPQNANINQDLDNFSVYYTM